MKFFVIPPTSYFPPPFPLNLFFSESKPTSFKNLMSIPIQIFAVYYLYFNAIYMEFRSLYERC